MIYSMTGFGKASGELGNKKFVVEIKSLNSKQADIIVRMPSNYKEKEMELRSLLYKTLERGKIEFSLFVENNGAESSHGVNQALARSYYSQLKELGESIGESSDDYLGILMRMPEVLRPEREELDPEEWQYIVHLTRQAAEKLMEFREQEGSKLEKDFRERVNEIVSLSKVVEDNEEDRINSVKERIQKSLNELASSEKNIDSNRQEQELIYYLEKLDITEEKVRLKAHCDYFVETLVGDKSQGKKLSFITQEIGREINTIGSKANNTPIQRAVVQMKDELEKIKEQILNVL